MNRAKNNSAELSHRMAKRRLFPDRHGDFANLEELQDVLAGVEAPTVLSGFTKSGKVPDNLSCPHVIVYTQGSKHSYDFIKIDDSTYLLKLIKPSSANGK